MRPRRRPTVVYRVLDEEDLLSGTDFLDSFGAPPPVEVWTGDDGEIGESGPGHGGAEPPGVAVAGPRAGWRVALACAGALVLVVVVTRLAGMLLSGAGAAARGGRLVADQRPPVAPAVGSASAVAGPPELIRPRPVTTAAVGRSPAPRAVLPRLLVRTAGDASPTGKAAREAGSGWRPGKPEAAGNGNPRPVPTPALSRARVPAPTQLAVSSPSPASIPVRTPAPDRLSAALSVAPPVSSIPQEFAFER